MQKKIKLGYKKIKKIEEEEEEYFGLSHEHFSHLDIFPF